LPKTLAQRSSYRLFLWGLLLVPCAAVADAALDAVFFHGGTIQELLFTPSYHKLAARVLFSTFILAAIYLGMHYLANISQKEASLLQRNRDLALARKDLEELQDDLLRHLRNATAQVATSLDLLKTQCDLELDEKTRFLINNASKSCNRLSNQLETSLALTGLSFGEPRREQVKLDKLALDVVAEIQSRQPERQIEFKVHPWMIGWCDPKMLRQVIYNLFCNACDFIPASRQGCIEFGSFDRDGQKVLFVRDNGTGFSDAQSQRLFDAFRDGRQDPDLPKDTIRLAIARHIVHRHGGQIWAEGIQGAGGTIYFTYYSP
jgi:light-regulated signal transduction histidine kinase (bacteriophytochrome)